MRVRAGRVGVQFSDWRPGVTKGVSAWQRFADDESPEPVLRTGVKDLDTQLKRGRKTCIKRDGRGEMNHGSPGQVGT